MATRLMTEDELDFNADSLFNPMAFPINVGPVSAQGNAQSQVTAGLSSNQAAQVNPQPSASRLDLQSLITPEDAANIRMAYEIGAAYPIVRGNEVYSFNPDGSIEYTRMNPGGIGATIGLYSSTGEEIVPQYYNADFGKTSTATRLLQAGLAAGIGGILGPAGAGLLSAPLASAAGAGLTSYGITGDLESALKAAALGGATAYGFGELFPTGAAANTDAAFIAADAAQLAAQGLGEAQISTVLQASGVVPSVAANVAAAAAEGLNPQQIMGEVGNLRFNAPVATPEGTFSSLNPNQVVIPGQSVVGEPFDLAALSGGLLTPPVVPTAPAVATPTQTTTVEGTRTTPETPTTVIPPIVPPVVPTAPTTVTPTQTTTIETSRTTPETPATVVPPVVAPVVPAPTTTEPTQTTTVEGTKTTEPPGVIIPSIPPAVVPSVVSPEKVEVTAKKPVSPEEPLIVIPPTTPLPPVPPEVAKPPVKPVNPPGESLFNPSDILKLLALLGGTSAVGGVGTGGINIGSVPTSDTMLGSTTPQFGPDYYAAVQRYYNAYMPETPRNVAGPLQQWYENKYGA